MIFLFSYLVIDGFMISEEILYWPGPTNTYWQISFFFDTKDPNGA